MSRLLPIRLARPLVTQNRRLLHASSALFAADSKKGDFPNDTLDQGNVSKRDKGVRDAHADAAHSGYEASKGEDGHPMDAASPENAPKTRSASTSGNPEQVGFAEQVGGQSASADHLGKSGGSESGGRNAQRDEEAATPGVFSTLKRMIGFGTDAGDVKQNRGGGSGVTGTGTFGSPNRKMHTASYASISASGAGEPTPEVAAVARGAEKDRPSSVDYMADVAERKTEGKGATVAHPRARSTKEANGAAHHSGEWHTAGVGDPNYHNVGKEEPYEPVRDDTDADSKEDSKKKKLRYGGLDQFPKIV